MSYIFGVQIKLAVAAVVAFKGVGGLLFIFGSTIGAFLLVSIFSSLILLRS